MPTIPGLTDLMKAGVHFGHQKSKWHPKMKPFIFTEKNGLHIINLEQTQKQLETALNFVKETVAAGGTVLFLGTKKQAQAIMKDGALACGMPYVIYRWLGGTLTNASSVLRVIKKYRKLKEDRATGVLASRYTKREQLEINREIETLEIVVGGMEKLDRIPDALFVVDIKKEQTAVREAIKKGIPTVALCDTNVNPQLIDYPIPANDDAMNSIRLFVDLVVAAVKEGQDEGRAKKEEVKK